MDHRAVSATISSWQVQKAVTLAMQTLDRLREEDGLIIETDAELSAALADEHVGLDAVLARLVSAALDAKANAIAAEGRIADLRIRRERFQRHETAYRATLAAVMEAIGLRKFASVEASVSLADGKPKVIITDVDALHHCYVREEVVRTPDKALIKSALDLGPVDGAELSNAQATLTIRPR